MQIHLVQHLLLSLFCPENKINNQQDPGRHIQDQKPGNHSPRNTAHAQVIHRGSIEQADKQRP